MTPRIYIIPLFFFFKQELQYSLFFNNSIWLYCSRQNRQITVFHQSDNNRIKLKGSVLASWHYAQFEFEFNSKFYYITYYGYLMTMLYVCEIQKIQEKIMCCL